MNKNVYVEPQPQQTATENSTISNSFYNYKGDVVAIISNVSASTANQLRVAFGL